MFKKVTKYYLNDKQEIQTVEITQESGIVSNNVIVGASLVIIGLLLLKKHRV